MRRRRGFRRQPRPAAESKTGSLSQYRLDQPSDPDRRREEQPEWKQRRCLERTLPEIAAHEVGAECRQGREFDHRKDRYEAEPHAGDGGELDIAEPEAVAA